MSQSFLLTRNTAFVFSLYCMYLNKREWCYNLDVFYEITLHGYEKSVIAYMKSVPWRL